MDIPVIRSAAPDDFEQVLALWESLDRHVGLPDTLGGLERLHSFAPGLFLVATVGKEIVGTLIAGWDGWRAQMARLATRPDWQRRGIAAMLVREGERRLRERGAQRIYALVDRRSGPAEPFWTAAGYSPNANIVQYSKNVEAGHA
jgi:ribosomal protein S18 acetylase RimI-like enzyme